MQTLADELQRFSAWRASTSEALTAYGRWLTSAGLHDAEVARQLEQMLVRLEQDTLSVAFVAEFSRGKSELINAMFFGQAGRRVLPSTAGRTTMCPTEILHDPSRPPSLRLLPVQTRVEAQPLSILRQIPEAWHEIHYDVGDVEALVRAVACVRDTIEVPTTMACEMGFAIDDDCPGPVADPAAASLASGRGDREATAAAGPRELLVQVPRWRHAILNYPHPLLSQGLVIVDTPGLNALGAEPELTLRLIPDADAVLFVLAADTGVTRSDIHVWRDFVMPTHAESRFVVLNKIDGLWDEIEGAQATEAQIAGQVANVSKTLGLDAQCVFPVSAQKGLLGRLLGDEEQVVRSRLPALEAALSQRLLPRRKRYVASHLQREFDLLHGLAASSLKARRRGHLEHRMELDSLRGRSREGIGLMLARIEQEREDFTRALRQLQALRGVFSHHAQGIGDALGPEVIRRYLRDSRELMRGSHFSTGLRDGMAVLLAAARADFEVVGAHVAELGGLMKTMYRSFAVEHGLSPGTPIEFSMKSYADELARIEGTQRRQFGTASLVTTAKPALTRKFFELVATRMRELYAKAAADAVSWQRALMAPLEAQVRDHHAQLRLRGESVRRVHEASASLEGRLAEVDMALKQVETEIAALDAASETVAALLRSDEDKPEACGASDVANNGDVATDEAAAAQAPRSRPPAAAGGSRQTRTEARIRKALAGV